MRGTDRPGDYMTPDLLCVWTDPDTAMEVVGRSLGIFGARVSNPTSALSADSPLRNALSNVLTSLVEGGVLEQRPCGGGRYAYRWRDDIESAVVAPAVSETVSVVDPVDGAPTERARRWPRLIAPTAPLTMPALSCLLAILVFVLLDQAFALAVAAALTLVGVIGLVRRVPFAGLWTLGLVVAGFILRFS
jgi:hypothetical protein